MNVSLLWPNDVPVPNTSKTKLSATAQADLNLPTLVRALDFDNRHSHIVSQVLTELQTDLAVISYRQEILADFLNSPALVANLTKVLPHLVELTAVGRGRPWSGDSPLTLILRRLSELENYIECVERLWTALQPSQTYSAQASGLINLREMLAENRAASDYQRLKEELPKLRAQLEQVGSVTIGVNLDAQLRPASATILAFNKEYFGGKTTLLERLLGDKNIENKRGLTQLYRAEDSNVPNAPQHQLFKEMSRLLERVVTPISGALERYTRVNSSNLLKLEGEIAFYLGSAKLFNEMRGYNLAFCRPAIAEQEEDVCSIEGGFSLDLALRLYPRANSSNRGIVPNDVKFEAATIFILTGPNSGGKTTYLRQVGQSQVLFQAGLLVPGRTARISPADGIFTHFATVERVNAEGGRLAEELERFAALFKEASPHSLILLNEPLASTDHNSARVLSRDILAGLRLLNARTIYVTHLHELIEDALADEAMATVGPPVVSLVAAVTEDSVEKDLANRHEVPIYRIVPGRPQSVSFAAELARQHGLNLSQIQSTLHNRGLA